MMVLAVDVGGTSMRAGIVAPDGTVVDRRSVATASAADGVGAIVAMAEELIASHPEAGDAPAVVGVPGRVDHRDGVLETAANLPAGFRECFREDVLSAALGRRCHLGNDADLATVGEAWFGAARGHDDVLFVTISTGIGAGLVLGRRLVHGRRSGGEIGHTVIDYDGSMGGRPRTVEELGSGTALAAAAAEAGLPPGAELAALVRDGDPAARAVWERTVWAAAVGISNLMWIAAPSVVVVGGGLGRNGDLVLDPIRQAIATVGPEGLADDVLVVEAALGDDAGLAGAAAWGEALGIGA